MYQNQVQGEELSYDGTITQDSQEFVILVPGEYQFRVTNIEKTRSKGEGKLPSCNMVKVTCSINSPQGTANIIENLVLHTSLEWKLSQFFSSIGQKKKGEPLRMNWNNVMGATGKCSVINEEYNGNLQNRIKAFLLPDDYNNSQPVSGTSWQAGSF